MTGTVVWFNNAKGFGFLARNEGGADIFVHHTDIVAKGYRSLDRGAPVEFDTELRDGKTVATNVYQTGEGTDGTHSTATH